MNCPKCGFDKSSVSYETYETLRTKYETIVFDFCPKCGEKLREKCSECGEMEMIGRPVCETDIGNISKAFDKAVKDAWAIAYGKYRRASFISLYSWWFLGVISALILGSNIPDSIVWKNATDNERIAFVITALFVWILLGLKAATIKLDWSVKQRAEEKFWRENTDLKIKWDRHSKWLNSQNKESERH